MQLNDHDTTSIVLGVPSFHDNFFIACSSWIIHRGTYKFYWLVFLDGHVKEQRKIKEVIENKKITYNTFARPKIDPIQHWVIQNVWRWLENEGLEWRRNRTEKSHHAYSSRCCYRSLLREPPTGNSTVKRARTWSKPVKNRGTVNQRLFPNCHSELQHSFPANIEKWSNYWLKILEHFHFTI